ncbi:helix-turn-helix domain-containing protein [Longispora albida]|uniref:helix-turn-helix domain-containing protein n=1 Tax=Longispora albida TaxID=203523 RepID=UPI00037338EF|nr:XRE family transcriptional regulator [Longispora albida]
MQAVLAANLRTLRAARNISLSELSRRSGIGKATLSQLEGPGGNPTIETLFSLSRALDVPVSALVSEADRSAIALVRAGEGTKIAGAAVDLRLLHRLDAGRSIIEVYEQVVRPGTVQHSEGHPGLEHIHLVSGVLRVGPPHDPFELRAGDYVCFSASMPHSYEAVGGPTLATLILQHSA